MTKLSRKQNPKYYPDVVEKFLNPQIKKFNKKRKSKHKLMEEKHKSALEDIAKDPSLIRITNSIYTEIEKKIYKCSKEIGEIDGIIINDQYTYYLEYKCNDCETNRNKAKHQLEKIPKYIEEKYDIKNAKFLYVHGRFKVYELTEKGFIPFNEDLSTILNYLKK